MIAERTLRRYRKENAAAIREIIEAVVHFFLGIIVCRGVIFVNLAPFGSSYVAAVPRNRLIWSVAGTAVGYIILNPSQPFRYVAVTIAIAVVRWTLEDVKLLSRSILYAPTVAFLPILASGIAMMFVSTSTLTYFSTVVIEALLAAGAAYFLKKSMLIVDEGRRFTSLSQSEMACIVLAGCVVMLSLGSIEVERVSLGRILSVAVIMVCARYGGASGGALAGVATGSVFGLTGSGYAFICAGYSFGGLIGGLFSVSGKLGVAVSFVICDAIMLLSAGDGSLVLPMFMETLVGLSIFLILPKEVERYITPLFLPRECTKGERSLRNSVVMRLGFASNAIGNVIDCVNSVSRELKKRYAPDVDTVYEGAAEDVCKNCGMRVYCWERHKNITREDFARLSAPLKSQGFVTENDVESLFSKKCCRQIEVADSINRGYCDYIGGIEASERVGEIRSMVAGQFSGLSEILGDLSAEIENYKSYDLDSSARVLEYLRGEGLMPVECSCMIDTNGRMSVEIQLAKSRTALKKNALARDISELCARCFDTPLISEIGTQKRVVLNEIPVYDIEVGVFQHVFNRGKLCGDCVNCFSNGFGEFVAMISDGMGTGGRAAVDSNMTVSVMTKLLKAGLSEDCALKVVNSALMVKSEDESLSTVDLLKIDLFSGKAVFNKAGAPYSYIKKNGHLLKKTATSLPVGILGNVSFSKEKIKLSGGDVAVMLSDGAFSNDEKWLEKLIRDFSNDRCSDLAKEVVNEAIKHRDDGHDDDITAVVIRMIEN
ncbi:MAG: serine/threonine-protein phosphatase [Ruminococcus sp.]|nr:serine/threonine-protein phosphatase [Ruminococcus sp.]